MGGNVLGQVLYDPGQPVSEVYFPIRSLTSPVNKLPDDHQVDISLGRGGV